MLTHRGFASFAFLTMVFLPTTQAQLSPPQPANAARGELQSAYGRLPLYFEENLGQNDARVRFVARGAGYALFITDDEALAVLQRQHRVARQRAAEPIEANDDLPPAVVRMRLAGANAHPVVRGEDLLPGKSNYFIGNDPSKWRTNVPQYAKVRLGEVYRGIDVVYYGNQHQLEYDLVVRPGADPRQIRLHFEGARRIVLDAAGDLVFHVAGGELRQRLPAVYQEVGGVRHRVRAAYRRLSGREIGIDLDAYDIARPLIIDPTLVYSTYLGGSGTDYASAIAVDGTGNAYVSGTTLSIDFPTMGPLQASYAGGGSDAFVAKLNATGSALVYSTYLGGSSSDDARGIAVDNSGNAYVAGGTLSTDFPTMSPLQASNGGGGLGDAFVAKLNADGSALVYSTFLGGSNDDDARGIAVDSSGNAYVVGVAFSADFPVTPGAFQLSPGGGFGDAFVAKLDAAGSALVYSTYIGGNGSDDAQGIAVDSSGDAYAIGGTESSDFPTTAGALQNSLAGTSDAFVTKLNAAGSTLIRSTYLGGSGNDGAFGITVDGSANAYVTGYTFSADFPTTPGALQTTGGGGFEDAFVAKLNSDGSALAYSTYLGGNGGDLGNGIAVDSSGEIYVTGFTASTDFPIAGALQNTLAGTGDAFVTKLNPAGSALLYSTYLGGSTDPESAFGIAVDGSGNAYLAGHTYSNDFPTMTPLQPGNAGGGDAFVAKISPTVSADLAVTKSGPATTPSTANVTYMVTAANAGPSDAASVTLTDTPPAGMTFVSVNQTSGPAFACSGDGPVVCTIASFTAGASASFRLTFEVPPSIAGTSTTNTATIGSTTFDPNPSSNTASATTTVTVASSAPALSPLMLLLLATLIMLLGATRLRG